MVCSEVDPSLPTRVLPPLLELCLAALAFLGHPEHPFPLPVKHQSTHGTAGIPRGVACNGHKPFTAHLCSIWWLVGLVRLNFGAVGNAEVPSVVSSFLMTRKCSWKDIKDVQGSWGDQFVDRENVLGNPGLCPREIPVSQEKELAVHGRRILFPTSLLIYPHFASDIRQIGINSSS